MYYKEILPNGVKIVINPMPHMSSVTMGVWVGTGSRYESKANNGISHFLEHLLFKGTEKRSCRELKEAIESKGGIINGFTSEEITCYWAKVIPEHLPIAVDVLYDMVKSPSLKEEDIEKEKGVVLEEISMYLDLPMHYVHVLFSGIIWPEQPLGWLVAGQKETVKGINHEILSQYKEQAYSGANIVVSVAGAVTIEEAKKYVRSFKDLPKGEKNICLPVSVEQKEPRLAIFQKDTEQIHLCIGGRALSRFHADRFTLLLLDTILGGNMTSRLFEELREKRGLTYEIRSSVQELADTGLLVISAGLALNKLEEAVELILQELQRLKEEEVSSKELSQAKDYCRGQLWLGLENTFSYMQWLGEHELCLGQIPTPEEIIAKIESVSAADIKRISRELLVNENMCLAAIGPIKDSQPLKGLFSLK